MKTSTFLILLISLLSCTMLSAQQREVERQTQRAKNRARYKVDREVDKTVDKAVDNVIGGLFGKKKKKQEKVKDVEAVPAEAQEDPDAYDEAEAERQAQARMAAMLGGGSNEDWEPVKNEFPVSFEMTITSDDSDDDAYIKYSFDTWVLGMEIESEKDDEKMILVMDNEKGTITTVMGEAGNRQGYRMNQQVINMDNADFTNSTATITPTGNTKMIDNLFCREYLIKDEENTTHAWMTKEIQANFAQMFGSLSMPGQGKSRSADNPMEKYQEYGMMLEATTVTETKKGPKKTHVKISNVKTGDKIDRSMLDISDAKIMGIGN